MKRRYKVALFIGRFQPFHNGHLYSLKKCLEIAESVIIGIGSSQESGTENNPWSYEERKEMIESVIKGTDLLPGESRKVAEIIPVPDFPGDDEWAEYVLKELAKLGVKKEEVVCVSNNEWTNNVMENAGMNAHESGLYNRDELEGVKIREMMRKGDRSWEKRVPDCVILMCINHK